ncbi:4447_t:CDS:1 [Diversispora eburnea]|uniref:4447_t:CDS:1 n=1 Tax=Diversispora eburnea TaxID=1213867 RepID=A0A9N9FXA1_9GLOM|nr:4447_t:CDS:1 [Diversispora eburnea]
MNKKTVFYFFTALVVLIFKPDLSYSTPTIFKYNVDECLDFWTPEKIKKAKPLKPRNIAKPLKTRNSRFRKRSGGITIRNTTDSSKYTKSMPPSERKYDIINNTISVADVDQIRNFPMGILFISHNGDLFSCSASVINTNIGNIGLTAAHCLYDPESQAIFNNIMFSPGFDHGQLGPLNLIPVAQAVVTDQFRAHNDDEFDWGMMRFAFNLNGYPLEYYTGSLGWIFNVGGNVRTVICGYPDGGNLPNCPNNGVTLCTWEGAPNLAEDYYAIPDLELGNGASGAPFIMNYDPNTNLGWLYSNYANFDGIEDEAVGPIYDPIEFQALLGLLGGL